MSDELPSLPKRDPRGHKGTFGTVIVVGGFSGPDRRMIGAPALTATAALRTGAGLAKLIMPAPVLNTGILICPSATGIPIPVDQTGDMLPHEASRVIDEQLPTCDCLVVGPGMGDGEGPRAAALRAIQQEDVPAVVDADALNALAQIPELVRDFHAAAILTPHPGEFSRLAKSLNIKESPTDPAQRPAAAAALAQRLGCIVVLKGHGTIVSDGQRSWTCQAGGSELGTAGTGDILSGVIAGLISQFVKVQSHHKLPPPAGKPLDLYDAARLAVQAHALAGHAWTKSHQAKAGLLAHELADELPAVLAQM